MSESHSRSGACAVKSRLAHETSDPVAPDRGALAVQLPPDLARSVDRVVGLEHPLDLLVQPRVGNRPGRRGTASAGVVGRRRRPKGPAEEPDLETIPTLVDEAGHLRGRSSSWAKNTLASFRIWLARRSSRFSFSSSTMRARSSVVVPGRVPLSISAWRTQVRSVSAPMSSWRAMRLTTPWRSPFCWLIVVRTSWTARSFTSGGYRLDEGCFSWAMDPPFPRFGVSIKPRAVHASELKLRPPLIYRNGRSVPSRLG